MPRGRKKNGVTLEPTFIPYLKEPEILRDTIEAQRRRVFAIADGLEEA